MARKLIILMILVFAGSLVSTAMADDIAELRKEMEKQYNQLMQMQNKIAALEANQKKMAAGGGGGIPDSMAWLEKVKLYGDFRYRFETTDRDGRDQDRHRMRARIGFKTQINDEIMFDLRLATGGWLDSSDYTLGGDPGSSNQTLDSYFSSKSFWLDRAYLSYQSACVEGLTVLAGKMPMPFYNVGKNQLIWDSDLNPEGIAAQYKFGLGEMDEVFVNAASFYVDETSSEDLMLWGIQGGLAHTFDDGSKATAGVTYYDYMNIQGKTPAAANAAGNTLSGGNYMYDYDLLEVFGEYAMKINEVPFSVFGNWLTNTASGVEEDTAWLAGCKIFKAREIGDWAFSYSYLDMQADSTVGFFSDGYFNGGGTGGRGHLIGAKYIPAENTELGIQYYCNESIYSNSDFRRFLFDVLVKF